MKTPLQAWFDAWLAEHKDDKDNWITDLIYAKSACDQICDVRDTFGLLVYADVPYRSRPNEPLPRDTCKITGYVIGEHHSKSVRLPVYLFERVDLGIQFVMRGNFYDWKLSVISEKPLVKYAELFSTMFHTTPPVEPEYTGNELASCYFEGFPDEYIFDYYAKNPTRWSCSIGRSSMQFVVRLIMHELGAIKPLEWTTREKHRKQLDAEHQIFLKELAETRAKEKAAESAS